jgi:hypothetical protein
VILLGVVLFMPAGLPGGKKGVKLKEVISKSHDINWLSAARLFLFGARDVWFVVGIPIYFYAVLSDGTPEGNRAAFFMIGGFMAVWTVLYGVVQANAPRLLRAREQGAEALIATAQRLVLGLSAVPIVLVLIVGLLIFGAVFALNSAVHSYLILAFATAERVTMDVGFYYMANAGGRLAGTLLSGLCYQWGGVEACLAAAGVMLILSRVMAGQLGTEQR